jgi:hypothetical protein
VGQASRLSMTGNPAGRGTVPPTPGRARKIGITRQEPGNESEGPGVSTGPDVCHIG